MARSTSSWRRLSTVFRFALFLFVGVLVTSITSHLRRVMVRERSARAIGEERLEAQVAAYRGSASATGPPSPASRR